MSDPNIMSRPIGIFDSGIGGLTVFKEVRSLLPQEDIYYLGDTARVPYGTKSPEVIRKYAELNVRFLLEQGAKIVVVACNTASATALEYLAERFPDVPILGVIAPVVEHLAGMNDIHRVGVIGTTTTIRSEVYQRSLVRQRSLTVMAIPCPLFVPLVEDGILDRPLTLQVIDHYLRGMRESSVETLVLGCTHYPLLMPMLDRYFEGKVRIVDSAFHAAQALRSILRTKSLLSPSAGKGEDRYFVTDAVDSFRRTGELFLGRPLDVIEHI